MHFNEHFPLFRGGVLPGIPRPGFTEHFHVPLWVKFLEKCINICCFSTGSCVRISFLSSCLLSFLGVFLIARNRPKRKEPDRNFIRMEKIPGKFLMNPRRYCAVCRRVCAEDDALISWV